MPFQTYQGQGNHFGENNSQPQSHPRIQIELETYALSSL